jgi:pterin-4a-carbinolamine dehydratase
MNLNELQNKLKELNEWNLGTDSLEKEFIFTSFNEARKFINTISELSEKNTQFPVIIWDRLIVKLMLSTKGEGISEKDLTLAREIDKLYK